MSSVPADRPPQFAERLPGNSVIAQRRAILAGGTLAVLLLLGGHGSHSALATAVCLLLSLLLICFEMMGQQARPVRLSRAPLAIILCAAILPLLQLVPLPPELWTSLPGRELTVETLQAAGLPLTLHLPLTLDRLATLSAALHVLPTIAMFVAASRLRKAERQVLLWTIIGAAYLSFFTLIPGMRSFVNSAFAAPAGVGFSGFFANRNHQADLLLIASACVACLYAMRERRGATDASLSLLLVGTLLVGTLATLSRTALVLAPLVLGLSGVMVWRSGEKPRTLTFLVGGASVVLLVAWAAALYILPHVLERLSLQSDELRFREWPDVLWAIRQYFPWGSGIGTFDQVFRTAEQLNGLSIEYMNEAHNEYLQVLLEGGLPGLLLMVAALLWCARATIVSWLARDPVGQLASIAILIYIVHSVVDYPLRTISHAALLGTFAALFDHRSTSQREVRRGR